MAEHSIDYGVQEVKEGEGAGGGEAGALSVSWEDEKTLNQREASAKTLDDSKKGDRTCCATRAKDGVACTAEGTRTNGKMFFCGRHSGENFVTGGPLFEETVVALLGEGGSRGGEAKAAYSGGTPSQRENLVLLSTNVSPLNDGSSLSALHFQTPPVKYFKSALEAATAAPESRPPAEQEAVDVDGPPLGRDGVVERAGTEGLLMPLLVDVAGEEEGVSAPSPSTILPPAVVQVDDDLQAQAEALMTREQEVLRLERQAKADLLLEQAKNLEARCAAAGKIAQQAARLRADTIIINNTQPTTGQCGTDFQQMESASYPGMGTAQTGIACEYRLREGGEGVERGAPGQEVWGAASESGAGRLQGVCVSGPPHGEAGGQDVVGTRTSRSPFTSLPDTSHTDPYLQHTPFTSKYRDRAHAEYATAKAVGDYVSREVLRRLPGGGVVAVDEDGGTVWNVFFSEPLTGTLSAVAGYYLSNNKKTLMKSSNGAMKAAHAMVKAFGDTQGSGEAYWFRLRPDERASKISRAYMDASVKCTKLGHKLEAYVMESIADWWDRLGRTIVTLGFVSNGTNKGKEIVAQQLELMDHMLRDPNRLSTELTTMRVKAGQAIGGTTLFELVDKPGGPTAAGLAKKLATLEQQLTKQASSTRDNVNKITDATSKAKSGTAAELAKQTVLLQALKKSVNTLEGNRNAEASANRSLKLRLDKLESAAKT